MATFAGNHDPVTDTLMWRQFTWRGHRVEVIQQWTDPLGRPMLRFVATDDETMAAGMPVDEFLAEATAAPD
jgi:hypothetical protein